MMIIIMMIINCYNKCFFYLRRDRGIVRKSKTCTLHDFKKIVPAKQFDKQANHHHQSCPSILSTFIKPLSPHMTQNNQVHQYCQRMKNKCNKNSTASIGVDSIKTEEAKNDTLSNTKGSSNNPHHSKRKLGNDDKLGNLCMGTWHFHHFLLFRPGGQATSSNSLHGQESTW